eukprot:1140620-Pelagomonas_calceolata.AAC.4
MFAQGHVTVRILPSSKSEDKRAQEYVHVHACAHARESPPTHTHLPPSAAQSLRAGSIAVPPPPSQMARCAMCAACHPHTESTGATCMHVQHKLLSKKCKSR